MRNLQREYKKGHNLRYAKQVIELMAAYPGREFKPQQICRYVCPKPRDSKERSAVRIGVHRVLVQLRDAGSVLYREPIAVRGGYCVYWWRT